MIKSLQFACLFIFLVACSSADKNLPSTVRYSPETEKTFQEIERERLLEHYKQLRIEEGIDQQEPGSAKRVRPRPRVVRPNPAPMPKKQAPVQAKRPAPKVDIESQNMELEQNLSFFCMQKRKDSRFSTEGSCEEYTASVRQDCEQEFEQGDRGLLPCVKSKLK